MSRKIKIVSSISSIITIAAIAFMGPAGPAVASTSAQYESLPGSVAPFTAHSEAIGNVSGSLRITIQVWLRPNVLGAETFANAVSTPGGPLFHHYLSPDAYTARFGATPREASSVESWLRAEGFTSVQADSQLDYVRATASTSKIEAAFHVQLKLYRVSANVNAGPYQLRANDRPITVPTSLVSSVLGVTGLDNAAPILMMDQPGSKPAGAPTNRSGSPNVLNTPCSHYYGQHTVSGLPEQFGTTTFPTVMCGYSASQIRAAYGANTVNTGTGQTIALVELGLTPEMFLTLEDYAAANDMPAPNAKHYA
jgi:subtilase family serine protease